MQEQSFSEGSISLFLQTCSYALCMCNVSERYFYPRHIVISEDHLQSCIWMVPPIIKEATCSVVVFSRVLCFFETNTCSHLFFFKSTESVLHSSCSNSMIYLWFQAFMYWTIFVIWQHQLQPSISSMVLSLFHGSAWSDLLCHGHRACFTTLNAATYYNKPSVVDWIKFDGYCVYLRKAIVAPLF